jgi:hypothetical protein
MEKEARAGGLKVRDRTLNAILALMAFAVIARYVAWSASPGALSRYRRKRTVVAA